MPDTIPTWDETLDASVPTWDETSDVKPVKTIPKWMQAGGMGVVPTISTPLMGGMPIASLSQVANDPALQQSLVPILNPELVPSGEQIKRQLPLVPMPVAVASSALAKGAAGIGHYLTSPKGIVEAVYAATPGIGIAQRLKWFYDMAKGAGESGGNLTSRIEQAIKNPSAVSNEDWQGIADDAVGLTLNLYGAGKLGSHEAGRLTGIRQPLGRIVESEKTRLSKDLAEQLKKEAATAQVPTKYPTAERQLGVQVPVGPLAQPGIPELADAALSEAMRLVKEPGKEQEALASLRRAVEPPQVVPEQIAVAERVQGGGEAPYGKVSYMRPAEAPLPEATQIALEQEKKGVPNAESIRASEGQLRETGIQPQGIQETGGNVVERTPQTKEPVVEGTGGQAQGEVLLNPEPTKGIITGRGLETWADDVLRGGATHAGPDVFAAYLVKGAALIERGVINFAEWSARMIAEHGPDIKPHLQAIYDAAKGTLSRAPISETGTLKSAREIVEQRLASPVAQTATTPSAAKPKLTASLDDVYKIFEPEEKEKKSVGKQISDVAESVRTGFSSKFRPVNKLVEDIAKHYGIKNPKDIAGVMEQLKGSSGKGEAQIYRFNRDVASLVKGDERDFNAYMFLNRSLDRLRQDERDIQRAMAGEEVKNLNRRAVADYTIPELEAKLGTLEQKLGPEKLAKFRQASEGYQRYLDEALKLQVESGRMSQEVYNKIKSENQFYAPFKILKYLEDHSRPEGTGAKIDTVADYTKAMKGIEDPNFKLGDMLAAARGSILVSRILADKANAMRLMVDQAAIDTEGVFIRKLKPNHEPPQGWSVINVFENGKKVQYATRPEVADAVQLYQGNTGGVVSQILSFASVPFKAGATALNIPFQVSNLLADVPRQALVSKYGIRGVSDLVRYPLDIAHAFLSVMEGHLLGRDNKLFQDFLDSGSAATTVQEHLTPKALKYRDPNLMSASKRVALNILYSPAEFSAAIEQVSKVLGVKRAMRFEGVKSGAELAKRAQHAVTEIRRFSGSPDFGRQGKWVEQARLNLLYMFLNARIQGAVADVGRLTGRDGAKTAAVTWFRLGAAVGIPTAYLYSLNNSPIYKKDYDARSEQEKTNYWMIPKDSFITNEDGQVLRDYWRIPKRESAKWVANMVEAALTFGQQKDPKSFANFGIRMLEDISPVNVQGDTGQERIESVASSLNPMIKGPLELATGRDMYRHRQLVPESMKKASPEQQYTDRTAEAFKKLAVAMPDVMPEFLRSPILIENMTRNLTAGMLTQFLKPKPVQGRTPIENAALLQRFQAIPYTDNEAFTKQMRELEREAADEYLNRHRVATKVLEENQGKQIGDIIRAVGNDPKTMKHAVDLWMSKANGATTQDRQLIALPPKQRAQYIKQQLSQMTPEQKQQAILGLAKKRVLTQSVFEEMAQLP